MKQMRKGNLLQLSFQRVPPDHKQHMEMTGKIKPCHDISAKLSWKCLGITLKTTNGSLGLSRMAEPACISVAALKFIHGTKELLRFSCHHHQELNKNHIKFTLHFCNSWQPHLKVIFNPMGQRKIRILSRQGVFLLI